MPRFEGRLGRMAGLLHRRESGALTKEDLSSHIWVAFQRALAHEGQPNWWEVRIHPADAQPLGGTDQVALDCLRLVSQEWAEEGRDEQLEMQDVVVCVADEALSRGQTKIEAESLDERALTRRVIAAQAAGLSMATGLKPHRQVEYVLSCPWDGARVPVSHDLSIGRDATNDVVVPGSIYVSHAHGQLVHDEGSPTGWSYLDLGSTNGSAVNGEPVKGKVPLNVGDRIGLGGVCFVVFEGL